ncbi:MAG: Hsp70 family protein [Lachnospiraceae bacterium]|nr:Hsp70 family protein [Lachnospiraceae bacterium]
MNENQTIVGIDLGTSTTEIAVIKNGKPVLLENSSGLTIIPSVVGLDDDDNWIAGERAKAQLLLSPRKTAAEIKRKIGTEEEITLGNRSFSAAELSAKLLEYSMKESSNGWRRASSKRTEWISIMTPTPCPGSRAKQNDVRKSFPKKKA